MDLRAQLQRDEGCRLSLYRDPAGKLTIGCGHNLDDLGITEAAMRFILEEDIAEANKQLTASLPWVDLLDPPRHDAFTNLCFNMGIGSLLQFHKMLDAAKGRDWITAAQELIDSDYGRGVTRFRAARLAKQLISGEYQ